MFRWRRQEMTLYVFCCLVFAALLYSSDTQTMWPNDLVLLKVTPGVLIRLHFIGKDTHTHTHSDTHHQCRDSKSDNLVCVCVFVWSLLTLISQRLYCEFKWAHLRFSPSHWLFLTSLLYQYSNHPIQHKCRHSSIVYSNMDRNFFQLSARKSWFTVTRLLYRHKQQTNIQQINHEDVKLGTDVTPSRSLSSENQKRHL